MRSFRKAALAGATAAAVAFGSVSVATAQDASPVEETSLSTQIDNIFKLEGKADKYANGTTLFGSQLGSEEINKEDSLSAQPVWAQLLYAVTILGGIGTLLGLVAGPVLNFFKFHPIFN